MKYRSIRVALAISAACWLLAMTGAPSELLTIPNGRV